MSENDGDNRKGKDEEEDPADQTENRLAAGLRRKPESHRRIDRTDGSARLRVPAADPAESLPLGQAIAAPQAERTHARLLCARVLQVQHGSWRQPVKRMHRKISEDPKQHDHDAESADPRRPQERLRKFPPAPFENN